MPSTGAAKAKLTPAVPPTDIDIRNGIPDKKLVYVDLGGTVRFNNGDNQDYRIRLWTKRRLKHPVINVLLSSLESVTCMTDPVAKKKDDCKYDLQPTDLQHPAKRGVAESGGGGRIIIGPTPAPPPKREKR